MVESHGSSPTATIAELVSSGAGVLAVAADASRRAALANGATGLARFNGGAALIACHRCSAEAVAGLAARASGGLALVDYAALAMAPDLAAKFEHVVLVDAPRTPLDVERVTIPFGAAGPSLDTSGPAGPGAAAQSPTRPRCWSSPAPRSSPSPIPPSRLPPPPSPPAPASSTRSTPTPGGSSRSPSSAARRPRERRSPGSSARSATRARHRARSCARRSPGRARTRSIPRAPRGPSACCASWSSLRVTRASAPESSASYPLQGRIWSARRRSGSTAKSFRRHSHFCRAQNFRRAPGAAR